MRLPAGSNTKVPASKVKSHTGRQIELFWPTGHTANTDYTVFMKGVQRDFETIRFWNTVSGFHAA